MPKKKQDQSPASNFYAYLKGNRDEKLPCLINVDGVLHLIYPDANIMLFYSRDCFTVFVLHDLFFFGRPEALLCLSHMAFWCFICCRIKLVDSFDCKPWQ